MAGKTETEPYGVSQLTAEIKGLLKPLEKIFVEGEISGWKVYPSGHAYFTVKDEGAQLPCVMFASSIARCKASPRLNDGAKVLLFGRLDVYAARGAYQLVVLAAKIAGEGELMARYLELKERLGKEGLFDEARKKPLPFLPHRIGIVTSPAGAVIHDMCTVLTRRFPNVEIRLYPVKVQGPGAKESIVEGIKHFNDNSPGWIPDVLIVGRGGGSIEDLWAFNEECVVRAVAESRIPVVSAVGHDSDYTLCDFAADRRAGTPSIAAEIVMPEKAKLAQKVRDLSERLKHAPMHAYETYAQKMDHMMLRLSVALRGSVSPADASLGRAVQRLAAAIKDSVVFAERRINQSGHRLAPALKDAVALAERRLARCDQALLPAVNGEIARVERRLVAAQAKLDLLDPNSPLKRGYSLTFDAQGRIVRRAGDVRAGDELTIRLGEGEIVGVAK